MRKGRILILSVILLLCSTVLLACFNKSKDTKAIEEARSSKEDSAAGELREQLRDEMVNEIVLNEDVTVMGCLVVKGTKTIRGEGTIILAKPATAGIYQDLSVLDDARTVETEDLMGMMETSVLYIDSGAELTLAEHVTVDSNQVGNGIVVCDGGNFAMEGEAGLTGGYFCNVYNEGTVTFAGGTIGSARGYDMINDGTVVVSAGTIGDGRSKGGIFNRGELTVTGGEIKDAGTYNIFVADGATASLEGGTVSGAGKANVAVDTSGEIQIAEGAAVRSGATGILNYGKAELDQATIEMNLINLQNYGTAEIKDSNIQQSTSNNIVNEETGSIVFTDTNLTNSGGRAITNQKGSISFEGLSVRRAGGEAIFNSGGDLKGEDLVIYGSAGTAIDNIDSLEGISGTVEINGLEIQTGTGMNIIQESSGTMTLTDAEIGITAVTSVKLISGTMNLDEVEIQGTSSTGAGIWTIGGKLHITNSKITSTKGRAMALAGGEVTGENIEFQDIVNTGIDGMNHDNGYTSVKAEFSDLTFSGGEKENVSVTSKNADVTIHGAEFGKTLKNNVRVTNGKLTLESVKVRGNVPGENPNMHGIYMTGGTIIMKDCEIRDPLACAIRNKGGEVIATNLKTYSTPAAAITNAANDSGAVGSISIDGLTVSGAKLGAIKNECGGTFTVKNGNFGESMANQVMVKEGKMYLENTVVNRAIKSEENNYHNVYVTGGFLNMKSVTLKDSDACGIRQTGGTIEGSNVTVTDAKINTVNLSGGQTTLRDSTLGLSLRTSVNLTDESASIVLDNVKVQGAGDTEGNNVNCVYIAPGAKATLRNGTVVSGSVTRAGILCEGGNLIIDGAEICNNATRGINLANKSVTDEAGVTTQYQPNAQIAHANIHHNGNNTVSGAAFYNEGILYMTDSVLADNTATTGGAINVGTGSQNTLKNVTITGNSATGNGGAIHVSAGAFVEVSGGSIRSNTAGKNGNAVRVNSSEFYLSDQAVIASDNDVYLENGCNIKTRRSGIGNTASDPLHITCTNSNTGTVIVASENPEEAAGLNGRIVCQDTKGKVLDITLFNQYLVIGDTDAVDWTARILNADGTYTSYLSIQDAINAVPTNGELTRIELMRDVTLTASLDIPEKGNRNILLTDDGNGPYTITRGFTGGRMIILRTGNQLTLQGSSQDDSNPSLILDGAGMEAVNNQQTICVGTTATNKDATLTLNSGVRLTGNKNGNGGGALIVYGKLVMNGGMIDHNESVNDHGGAIYVMATGEMTMSGGTISNNTSKNDGGAILITGTATLTMTGGTIAENTGRSGGAIILNYSASGSGTFHMSGGTIKDNKASSNGGAIFVHSKGTVTMTGGSITGNSGGNGGAVYLHNNAANGAGIMHMTGGAISSNTASGNGGGVGMAAAANSLDMTGGIISSNSAGRFGNDIYGAGSVAMQDTAYAGSLYLAEDNVISLTGALSARNTVTEVTMGSYPEGRQVLDGDAAVITADYVYFATPEGTGADIDSNGRLKANGEVVDYTARIRKPDGTYVGYMTLEAALEAAATDGSLTTIEVMKDITLTASLDIPQNSNRNILLTDDGNGPYTITRAFTGDRMIILRTGNQMTLEGSSKDDSAPSLIFDGGNMEEDNLQQIICVGTSSTNKNAALTLDSGVKLTGNNNKQDGGAIIVYGSLNMKGGVVDNNKASGHGGAVTVMATGEMTLAGGTISNNTSKLDGGAIIVQGTGKLTMTGGTITGNAGRSGGAIILNYSGSTSGTLAMSGGSILNNTATSNGGAIFVHAKGTLTMTGGSITGNSANNGGAVYLHNNNTNGAGSMQMSAGTISGNTAKSNGGGVGMAAAANALTMTGGSISDNSAAGNGKDIQVAGTLSMKGSAQAGSIYLAAGKTINLTGDLSNRSEKTEVTMPTYTEGTAVLSGDASVIARNYSFFATPEGSGVDIDDTGHLKSNSEVIDYTARIQKSDGSYEGYMTLQAAIEAAATDGSQTRIELMKDITLTTPLDIPEKGNRNILLTDDGKGPHTITRGFTGDRMIILRTGNQLTLEGSGKNDSAPSLILDGANMTAGSIQQIICVGTSATNKNATLTINAGVKLTNNNNTNGGGAAIVYGTMNMNGGVIDKNKSTNDHGGAIYIMTGGEMTLSGGIISNNSSKNDGGAILVNGAGKLTMTGGEISGNSGRSGGAIILNFASSAGPAFSMSGGTIKDNTATGNGGAVFVHSKAVMTMTGGSITGNQGVHGGAVYLHYNATNGPGTMIMSDGSISQNTATGNGGGVGTANAANTLTMTGGTISGNSAAGTGQDIHMAGSLSMKGSAQIGSVYLVAGKTVNLTGALDSRSEVTEVILPAYAEGTTVLSGDASAISAGCQYFKTPDDSGMEIGGDGTLKTAANTFVAAVINSIMYNIKGGRA